MLKGLVLRTGNRLRTELNCNWSYRTVGPGLTTSWGSPVLGFHSHQHLLEPLRTGLNWFSTGLMVLKKYMDVFTYLVYKKIGHAQMKRVKSQLFKYPNMSTDQLYLFAWSWHFHLCVFDTFTCFVYIFTLICNLLPQLATHVQPTPTFTTTLQLHSEGEQGPNDDRCHLDPR